MEATIEGHRHPLPSQDLAQPERTTHCRPPRAGWLSDVYTLHLVPACSPLGALSPGRQGRRLGLFL